jgi:hypothetical protein
VRAPGECGACCKVRCTAAAGGREGGRGATGRGGETRISYGAWHPCELPGLRGELCAKAFDPRQVEGLRRGKGDCTRLSPPSTYCTQLPSPLLSTSLTCHMSAAYYMSKPQSTYYAVTARRPPTTCVQYRLQVRSVRVVLCCNHEYDASRSGHGT